MQESSIDLSALIARLPDADSPGRESKFTGPDPEVAGEVLAAIVAGGKEAFVALVDRIRSPSDEDYVDFRPAYLLHALAVRLSGSGEEDARRALAEAIASRLGGEKPSAPVQECLVRELQATGGPEVLETLGKLLDGALCPAAIDALVAIGAGAAPVVRKALPGASGRNRLSIIQALGVLRDEESAPALIALLEDSDREVRIAAAGALANIGSSAAAGPLLRRAAAEGWERTQAAKACLVLAERLAAAGKTNEANSLYVGLRDSRTDPAERYVREAAERGLAGS